MGLLHAMVITNEASLDAFNAAIQVCAKSSQSAKALELLREMGDCNIKPPVFSITSVISACARAEKWQLALDVLGSMEASYGVKPNVITLSSVISACAKGGQWEKALALFESMEGRSLQPDVITLSAAISAFAKGGQ